MSVCVFGELSWGKRGRGHGVVSHFFLSSSSVIAESETNVEMICLIGDFEQSSGDDGRR